MTRAWLFILFVTILVSITPVASNAQPVFVGEGSIRGTYTWELYRMGDPGPPGEDGSPGAPGSPEYDGSCVFDLTHRWTDVRLDLTPGATRGSAVIAAVVHGVSCQTMSGVTVPASDMVVAPTTVTFPNLSVTSASVAGSVDFDTSLRSGLSLSGVSFSLNYIDSGNVLSGSFTMDPLSGPLVLSREPEDTCEVAVDLLKQNALPWGPEPYDHIPPATIASKGCALTSLAMAINAEPAVPKTDPLALNAIAKYTSGDSQTAGSVIWQSTLKEHHPQLKMALIQKNSQEDLQGALDVIRTGLCDKQRPVILRVPGHFVVATAIKGNEVTIADPGYPKTLLSEWAWFETRGYVYDPPNNLHTLDVALSPKGALLLTAPDGLRTGLELTRDAIVQDIPDSAYFVDSIDSIGISQEPSRSVQVAVREPADGRYAIDVIPEANGFFDLQVLIYANDGTVAGEFSIRDIGTVGVPKQVTVSLVTQPGGTSEVGRIVTFDSLREDILTVSRLGLLTNKGLETSLLSRVKASRAAMARGNVRAAVGPLSEIASFLDSQAGIHVDSEAAKTIAESANILLLSLK